MDGGLFFELKRQAVHLIAGLFVATTVWYVKPIIGDYIIVPMGLIVIALYITPRIASHLPVVSHMIHHFERDEDKHEFPFKGAFWYNLGVIAPVMFLPVEVACSIIVILSVGDSASTIIGRTYGRHRINGKSFEGLAAFIVFGTLFASTLIPLQQALTLSIFGGLIEFIPFDDNFLIPVGTTAVAKIFGF